MGLKRKKGVMAKQRNLLRKRPYAEAFDLKAELQKAAFLHRSGRLSDAESAYKKILDIAPNHADTLNLMGLVAFQKEEHDTAVWFIQKAIQIDPSHPLYRINLGNAFNEQNKTDEAADSYRRALSIQPDNAEALNNLGNALYFQGKMDEAISCYKKAIKLNVENPDAFNNLGSALRKLDRLEEATYCFRKALGLNPNHVQALNNLGLVLKEQNRAAEAILYYRKILEIRPDNGDAYINLAVALKADGRLDEGVSACRKVLELYPENIKTYFILGDLLKDQGKSEEAITCYNNAIAVDPNCPDVYISLGNVFAERGNNKDAVLSYKKAIMLNADYPEAYNNLGNALKRQGDMEEAILCYRKALKLEPDNMIALNNLGNALKARGKLEEAVACYENALSIDPEYAEAYNNLGNALSSKGKTDEAVLCFQKALKLRPDNVKTYNNFGGALRKQGKLSEAVEAFKKSLEIEPCYAEAYNNMAGVLLKQGNVPKAIESYQKALAIRPDFAMAHSNLLLACNYQDHMDPEWLFSQHRNWAKIHAIENMDKRHHRPEFSLQDRKLRLGYVSPDFRIHSVAYFLKAIIEAHDRSGFKIFCYSDVICPDEITRAFARNVDCFKNIAGIDNKTVADQIRRDKIDILVDLAGHTAGSRLIMFSMKPAPIQVTYLGYPNTTGLETLDYRLTDFWADPPGLTDHLYTEKLVRLPYGFLCYTPPEESPEIEKTGNLDSGRIVFGSFNNLTKITPEVVKAWAKILTQVHNGKMVLKSGSFADPETRNRLIDHFFRNGVGRGQIELVSHIPSMFDHLQLYNRIDIGLDTFPYNGTTTTCEALWMGVPVITLAGRTHGSRVGASLLSNVGLAEFIADSVEDYVEKGISLAYNIRKLKSIHRDLRSRMTRSFLMDAARFTGSLERAYRRMFSERLGSYEATPRR